MKNIYKKIIATAVIMLFVVHQNKAQVFPQSFEGATFPPTGWKVFDNAVGTIQSWTNSTLGPQSGTASAYVQYENVTTGIAEDWLVSPAVSITASTSILSYWEKETFATNWGSLYNILISSSSQTNVATFTTVTSYTEDVVNPLVYKNKVINLSAYIGQTIYIAFKMDNDDGDDWWLDNIQLTGGCTTPPFAGVITGTNSTNMGNTNSFTVSPVTGNIQWIFASTPTGPWTAIPGATATPQNITAAVGGTMYLKVVASSTIGGCLSDTSNIAKAVVVNFIGDNTCNAIPLTIGPSGTYYKFIGASVQAGEVMPPGGNCISQNSWCINTLDNTRWFTFVAPPSGHVTIQAPDFDTQIAVWKAATCAGLLSSSTATFVCANDDDPNYVANGGVNFSSYLHAACLTPGATYYIQADSYSPATIADSSRIIITTVTSSLNPGFSGLSGNYCLPSSTTASLTGISSGGIFTMNTVTTAITAFNPTSAGVGTHTITHSVSGCISNSTTIVTNQPTVTAVTSNSMLCAGQTATLVVTGASTYSWSSGGTGSSIIVSPSVTTTYSVTGTMAGCNTLTTVVQNVTVCSNINELINGTTLNIFPNPNEGVFTLVTDQTPDEVYITDLLGKKIYTTKPLNNTTLIEIKTLSPGIYFVNVKRYTITKTIKMIKD